jgi:hypothetical protein
VGTAIQRLVEICGRSESGHRRGYPHIAIATGVPDKNRRRLFSGAAASTE